MNKGRNLTSSKFEEEHDIISNLPEHILHHIFGFVDMKQAIQTCILSKRWRFFWVSLRTLNFNYIQGIDHITPTRKNKFMAFVDRVLMFRDNSNIHDFALVIPNEYYNNHIDMTRLETWILASIVRNVQQLTLDIPFPMEFHLHHCLLTCKSLTKLVVKAPPTRFICLSLPDSITLHRLKTLCLESVEVKDENLTDRLLSNCPVLESLCMKKCKFPHDYINISSLQLQHLVLEDCRTRTHELEDWELEIDEVDTKFKLWAPNLISFYCNSDMMTYHRMDMSKQCMVNILRELHNVEDLTLVASFLMVVTGAPDLLDSQPMKFYNLRSLKLTSSFSPEESDSVVDCMNALLYLLKISPNIETLSVEGCDGMEYPRTGLLDLLHMQPSHFCNLRCLEMNTLLSIDGTHMMACFLKISPDIETISFTIYQGEGLSYEWYPYLNEMMSGSEGDYSEGDYKEDYRKAGMTLKCLLNHLKSFELREVTGRINELEFIEILLNHAMLLEKLLIVFERISKGFQEELKEKRLVKFSEKSSDSSEPMNTNEHQTTSTEFNKSHNTHDCTFKKSSTTSVPECMEFISAIAAGNIAQLMMKITLGDIRGFV